MPGIDVKMGPYGGERGPQLTQDRYNSEDSLEDNQSSTSSTESSRQSDFVRKDHEFIPTRSLGIIASKPAYNPGQFTRVNSNPLLISATKQMHLVEEVRKKKKEVKVGDETPEWQSNLDSWKNRRRKQSEEALTRVSEIRRLEEMEAEDGMGKRKMSIGRKISLLVDNDDEIDIGDLPAEDESTPPRHQDILIEEEEEFSVEETILPSSSSSSHPSSSSSSHPSTSSTSNPTYSSRSKPTHSSSPGPSQTPPRADTEMAESKVRAEPEGAKMANEVEKANDPYQNAIDGYRTLAHTQFSTEGQVEKNISLTGSIGAGRSASANNSILDDSTSSKDEEWEKKIETYVQPTRKSSTDLSDKMRLKLASFEENKSAKPETATRVIQPDNSFRDKLKAFKNIETSAGETSMLRRDSEPSLVSKLPGYKSYRSSSSSALMNTFQNNKFFQQSNSLSSEGDGEDNIALDDALEESFSQLEEKTKPVFRAEDFIPSTERLAPPSEKPPPLPPVPPPMIEDEGEEDDLAQQEREIIESLEREETAKKKRNEFKGGPPVISVQDEVLSVSTKPSQLVNQQTESYSQSITQYTQHSQTNSYPSSKTAAILEKNGGNSVHQNRSFSTTQDDRILAGKSQTGFSSRSQGLGSPQESDIQTRRKGDGVSGSKDYNQHWLIQEAEQRRITEAQQKQNHPASKPAVQGMNKSVGMNHNSGMSPVASGMNNNARMSPVKAGMSPVINYGSGMNGSGMNGSGMNGLLPVTENIYANIDSTHIPYTRNQSGYGAPISPPHVGGVVPPAPQGVGGGPQVPPRGGDGQERVLSVSGKKKCSACKEELGRGAAMIIESLRLFYHIRCFKCCVCSVQLGNGEQGTDVRVRNNRLHCQNCYSNDEGLKFSKV